MNRIKSVFDDPICGKLYAEWFVERCRKLDLQPTEVMNCLIYGFLRKEHTQSEFLEMKDECRMSKFTKKFSLAVKKRDNYTCCKCKSTSKIESHHIVPIYKIVKIENITDRRQIESSKLLNDISNGVTLCHSCHRKEHKHYEK